MVENCRSVADGKLAAPESVATPCHSLSGLVGLSDSLEDSAVWKPVETELTPLNFRRRANVAT